MKHRGKTPQSLNHARFGYNGITIFSAPIGLDDFSSRRSLPGETKSKTTGQISDIREVMLHEAQAITTAASRLDSVAADAVDLLCSQQGRVVFSGMGKMGYIGRKAAATFCSTGSPAIFLHPAEAVHGDLGIVGADDIFVALSGSGQTAELLNLLPYLHRFGIPIIAITGNPNSELAVRSQLVLNIGIESETNGDEVAPASSTTVALALCDALAISVARKRGFTNEQFAMFHPGGYLGRKLLLTVAEIMHTGDEVPIANPDLKLRDAILEISQKRLGAVVVVEQGRIAGIVTDGDIRRILQKSDNPLDERVQQYMTSDPTFIKSSALAADALHLIQRKSITVLPVVDEQEKLIGMVHLHDLLQAGIA